jgi:hypothetical protein
MDDNTLSTLITASALVVFLISGWATFWIYRARRGGWNRLAASYGSARRRDSLARRWESLTLKPSNVHYRFMVSLRLTVDGLYLRPMFPFSFGHEPLLIPWNDIEIYAVETYPADRLYDLKLTAEPNVQLRVGVAVAQYIRRAADNVQYFVEPPVQVKTTVTPAAARGAHAARAAAAHTPASA